MSSKEYWTPTDQKVIDEIYPAAIPVVREVALKHGYAIGVHGSQKRDLDLIAAPWTPEASDAKTLAKAIAQELNWWILDEIIKKPHGRLAFTIYTHNHANIDLSVAPMVDMDLKEKLITAQDNACMTRKFDSRDQQIIELQSEIEKLSNIVTCVKCSEKKTCPYAYDEYNTNGDCLAEK